MNRQRITSIVFLFFSILVAVYNLYLGREWVSVFVLPFIPAVAFVGKRAKLFEFIGMYCTSIVGLFMFDHPVGIMFLTVSNILFYSITIESNPTYIYISITAAVVFISSFFTAPETFNLFVYSFLNMSLYLTMSIVTLIYIKEIVSNKSRVLPIDPNLLRMIDEASSIAHEAVEISKKLQEEKHEQ